MIINDHRGPPWSTMVHHGGPPMHVMCGLTPTARRHLCSASFASPCYHSLSIFHFTMRGVLPLFSGSRSAGMGDCFRSTQQT